MNTHTPGPWTVGRCSWNEDGNVCYELVGIKQGCAADAQLIAAAPKLLAAIRAILFQVNQGKVLERDDCITQAINAYADAAGVQHDHQ